MNKQSVQSLLNINFLLRLQYYSKNESSIIIYIYIYNDKIEINTVTVIIHQWIHNRVYSSTKFRMKTNISSSISWKIANTHTYTIHVIQKILRYCSTFWLVPAFWQQLHACLVNVAEQKPRPHDITVRCWTD